MPKPKPPPIGPLEIDPVDLNEVLELVRSVALKKRAPETLRRDVKGAYFEDECRAHVVQSIESIRAAQNPGKLKRQLEKLITNLENAHVALTKLPLQIQRRVFREDPGLRSASKVADRLIKEELDVTRSGGARANLLRRVAAEEAFWLLREWCDGFQLDVIDPECFEIANILHYVATGSKEDCHTQVSEFFDRFREDLERLHISFA